MYPSLCDFSAAEGGGFRWAVVWGCGRPEHHTQVCGSVTVLQSPGETSRCASARPRADCRVRFSKKLSHCFPEGRPVRHPAPQCTRDSGSPICSSRWRRPSHCSRARGWGCVVSPRCALNLHPPPPPRLVMPTGLHRPLNQVPVFLSAVGPPAGRPEPSLSREGSFPAERWPLVGGGAAHTWGGGTCQPSSQDTQEGVGSRCLRGPTASAHRDRGL